MTAARVLTRRALNRALLHRQGLLERSGAAPLEMVERLVGLQAQVPSNPYLALWSRIGSFRPARLSESIAERRAVRALLMRGTIHLVSARDCLALHPVTQPVLARAFQSNFAKLLRAVEPHHAAAAALELLLERPRTRAELAALLGARWPDEDATALAHAATYLLPLVQVPPRGLWEAGGQARWAPATTYLGGELDRQPSAEAVVLRYLASFGPATAADVRTWSGLADAAGLLRRLAPRLRTFADESGRTLFDVRDGALPDPETPAPVRFLPEYDNVLLSHADRGRIFGPGRTSLPFHRGRWIGKVLVDGFYRAEWRAQVGEALTSLTVERFTGTTADGPDVRDRIAAEGDALLELIAPAGAERRLDFAN